MNTKYQKGENGKKQSVFQFKITLNYSTPRIWRRILLPSNSTFFELHIAIQGAMGWCDCHLHDFVVDRKGRTPLTIKIPYPEFDEPSDRFNLDERKEKICDYFNVIVKQCQYEYDFGDGWNHTILFERELLMDGPISSYPRCIAGKNACPPEDCGSVYGYEDLQKILKNPKHPEYTNLIDWLCIDSGDAFDPYEFSLEDVEFRNPRQVLKEIEAETGLTALGQSGRSEDMETVDMQKPQNIGIWEIDWKIERASDLFPMSKEDEFINIAMVVEQESHYILDMNTSDPQQPNDPVTIFTQAAAKNNFLPKVVCVKKQELYDALLPISLIFDFQVELVKHLKVIPSVRSAMKKEMKRFQK